MLFGWFLVSFVHTDHSTLVLMNGMTKNEKKSPKRGKRKSGKASGH